MGRLTRAFLVIWGVLLSTSGAACWVPELTHSMRHARANRPCGVPTYRAFENPKPQAPSLWPSIISSRQGSRLGARGISVR